ncbi:MAG: phosphoglucomutase/phosphomannomutase family protein [Pyrinomonadaceae bacterium]
MSIRFGTSGWRAVIADEFTFANVELVTKAICSYLKTNGESARPIVIGNDSRFMGESFVSVAANIAASKGFRVLRCSGTTPTPAISFAIRSKGAAGGINFTASHNPPEYQGIKFSTADGAPALPEVTSQIEAAIVDPELAVDDAPGGSVDDLDARDIYLADLAAKIDFNAIASAGGRFAYDPLWGTGRGYLDKVLRDHGLAVETLHDWRDVTFGGQAPEPGEEHIAELKSLVIEKDLTLGLATDGDADRFGIIDSNGTFITPNELIAVLTDYLAESRGWKDGVARSVATSHLVDRVAEARGLELFETPVGFKFIGELINKDAIILGGEESAGLSIKGHYPEKDGILACLLAVEAVAVRKASLTEQLSELWSRVGRLYSDRIGVRLTPEVAEKLKEKLAADPSEIAGRKVENVNRLDGVKYFFAGGAWMLMRPSGTEPMVRIYAESDSMDDVERLLEAGKRYLLD